MANTAEEITINPNVEMDLHPAVIDQIAEQHSADGNVAQVLAPVRNWFSAAYDSLGDIYSAKARGLEDKSQTGAMVIIKLAASAERTQDRMLASAESVIRTVTSTIDGLNKSLEAPLTQTANRGHVASELRQHLKSLKTESERGEVLRKAISSGDAEVVGAILGAPALLSGISEESRTMYTRMWNAKAQPAVAARVDALTKARDLLAARAPRVMPQVVKALGADWGQVSKLKNASSEFEKTLIINRFV